VVDDAASTCRHMFSLHPQHLLFVNHCLTLPPDERVHQHLRTGNTQWDGRYIITANNTFDFCSRERGRQCIRQTDETTTTFELNIEQDGYARRPHQDFRCGQQYRFPVKQF
jgi:hypothetical protein